MSLTKFTPADASTPAPPNRRQSQRYEPRELTYVDLGPDNGGLLLNISEGGLGFEGIVTLSYGQVVPVEFKLPGTNIIIRATGQFARKEDPGRGGGLRFVDLTEEARQQIREWIAAMARRQDDSPQSVETAAATEAAEAAEPKAKIQLSDSPTITQEQQPTLLPPALKLIPVAPIPTPAPLAPAMPHANTSSVPPITRIATNHSQRPPSQAAAADTAIVEPKPALRAAPSASDAIRNQKNRSAASPHQPPVAPTLTYKTKSAANQRKAQDRAREPRSFGSQVLQFVAGATAGCLAMAVIAGALLWAGYIQLPSAVASRTSTEQNATGPSNPDFEVEIVNLSNQRWMLPMGAGNNPQTSRPPVQAQLAPAQNSENVPPRAAEPVAKAPGSRPVSAASPPLVLQRPRATSAALGSTSLPAPSLFEGITPPLPSLASRAVPTAPPVTALPPSREAGVSSPIAGLPAVTQPETDLPPAVQAFPPPAAPEAAKPAKSMSFRPAELAQRVDPVYPPQARQQQAQGTVQVSATIGRNGIPRNLKVVRGDPRLADAATAAIARWRYKPAMLDGQPIESQLIITINFQP